MRVGIALRSLAAGTAGAVLGGALTLAAQTGSEAKHHRRAGTRQVIETPERPTTFLVWTYGGLPEDFEARLGSLDGVKRIVAVRNDNTWLTGSVSAEGEVVDDPREPYAIPLDVSAADPRNFTPFLPPADRGALAALSDGEGILGSSSAKLRGLGPGAILRFGHEEVGVAAVLPDELVGGAELFVSRDTAARIGVTHDRYALLQTREPTTSRELTTRIERVLPPELRVQVRAPGETPFFRQGDAVLPPVMIKLVFGEFAARPAPGRPGFLEIDPAWVRSHIATRHIAPFGQVTCNLALMPQIRGVAQELRQRGLASLVHSYAGCYSPRFVNRVPTATLSHHSWGIALDVNVPQNPFGARPHQNRRLVAVFEDWGFVWGGGFLMPDGMHFEYHRQPASG